MHSYRGVFDRQDSLRSEYLSDRETRYGIVQQASIDSTDSRLCYLTSSEVSEPFFSPYFLIFSTPTNSVLLNGKNLIIFCAYTREALHDDNNFREIEILQRYF